MRLRPVQEKPIVLQWYSSECDTYDTYHSNEIPKTGKEVQEEKVNSNPFSHRSQTSQVNNSTGIESESHRPDKLINNWG